VNRSLLKGMKTSLFIVGVLGVALLSEGASISEDKGDDSVFVGLNYPKTGPYAKEGLDQWSAAQLAADEINDEGGILGKKVRVVWRDTQSRVDVAKKNAEELIDREQVSMIFGGSSSAVAVGVGEVCQKKKTLFFATLTYSTHTTGKEGHRHTFRECNDSWMASKALSYYLKEKYPDKKYYYITADYTWGHTTEASMRKHTGSMDKDKHKGVLIPFPDAKDEKFAAALQAAAKEEPDLLVLVLFGGYMEKALRMARTNGISAKTQVVVPNLTLNMAKGAGPEAMEGVMGTVPWTWKVPYQFDYHRGKIFVQSFTEAYGRYPSTAAASAYTVLYEYKAAVERTKSFESEPLINTFEGRNHKFLVIPKLRGREYTFLKDKQIWRSFDHQSLQTVYVVKGREVEDILEDCFQSDYFEIVGSLSGDSVAITYEEWVAAREAAGKAPHLEPLPGDKK